MKFCILTRFQGYRKARRIPFIQKNNTVPEREENGSLTKSTVMRSHRQKLLVKKTKSRAIFSFKTKLNFAVVRRIRTPKKS